MLGLLTIIAAFNYLDRFVLSLLLEPIKQEFQLNDSQLGFLTGFAFASFYAVAGIPLARWADRGNRNTIVSVTTALWSTMVAMCGLVGGFSQLLLVRIGVAVGEAGCVPPAQSLIGDYFGRTERPRAMAIYWMCFPIAVIIGYLGGGWLAETVGWRMTFILMGLPGLLLAIIAKLTLREPRLMRKTSKVEGQPSFKMVLNTLWNQRSLRHIVTAFCVAYFFFAGIVQWLPTFFIRSHAMETGELGIWFAFSWGVCAVLGGYLGGALTSRYAAHQEGIQMRAVALVFVVWGGLYVMVFLSSNKYQALVFMAATGMVSALTTGPIFSAIQSLVNERMRSVAIALTFLLANFIGLGLGPLLVGWISDLLAPMYGQESLRYASVLFTPGVLWVSYHYWKAAATIENDIRRNESEAGLIEIEKAAHETNTLERNISAQTFDKL